MSTASFLRSMPLVLVVAPVASCDDVVVGYCELSPACDVGLVCVASACGVAALQSLSACVR